MGWRNWFKPKPLTPERVAEIKEEIARLEAPPPAPPHQPPPPAYDTAIFDEVHGVFMALYNQGWMRCGPMVEAYSRIRAAQIIAAGGKTEEVAVTD